jgi:hypothetical protein
LTGLSRPWSPLASYECDDGTKCVDVFVRADGSYGFETFRRDAEDGGSWYITGHFAALRFGTRATADAAARRVAPWVRQ